MNHIQSLIEKYPILKKLECSTIIFNTKTDTSLASAIVKSNVPYKPGVYLIYEFKDNELGELLYVGKAGTDSNGKINSHQVPKRLLATIQIKEEYMNHPKINNRKEMTRDQAFPIMMEMDELIAIKIFCFFSNISNHSKVEKESNPLFLEKEILNRISNRPLKWAKR